MKPIVTTLYLLLFTAILVGQPQQYQTDAIIFGKSNNLNLYNLNSGKTYLNLLPLGPTPNQMTSYGDYFLIVNSGNYGSGNNVQIVTKQQLKDFESTLDTAAFRTSAKKLMIEEGGNAYSACGLTDSVFAVTLPQSQKVQIINRYTESVLFSIPFADGNPQGIIKLNDTLLAVAIADWGSEKGKHVAFINSKKGTLISSIETGLNTVDVTLLPDGNILAMTWGAWSGALNYGELVVIDRQTLQIKHKIKLTSDAKADQILPHSDSTVFVKGFDANYETTNAVYNFKTNTYTPDSTSFFAVNLFYGQLLDGSFFVKKNSSTSSIFTFAGVLTSDTLPFASGFNVPFRFSETVVPVELVSFSATALENTIVLNWETATELNNKGFSIQKLSGDSWISIGFVSGVGTTNEKTMYSYTDVTPSVGENSYRLVQIDFDGSTNYSSVIKVTSSNNPIEFALSQNFPNPFNPSTTIEYSMPGEGLVELKVFSVLGEEVATLVNEVKQAGVHKASFDASQLPSGMYIYSIKSGSFSATRKMILAK